MKILVTGGAGFIGSELVRQLAARGYHVRVLDNFINGKRENLQGIPGPAVELIQADIRDKSLVDQAMHGAAIVYHLACLGPPFDPCAAGEPRRQCKRVAAIVSRCARRRRRALCLCFQF